MMDEETDTYVDTRSELDRALDFYSDIYKDAYGFRPRHEWRGTLEDLRAEIDDLVVTVQEEEKRRVEYEEDCWRQFLKRVEEYSEQFSISRAKAIRWIFQADDVELSNIDQFCYENGLAYSREADIREMLNV